MGNSAGKLVDRYEQTVPQVYATDSGDNVTRVRGYRPSDDVKFRYVADGGGSVVVPTSVEPYAELGVPTTASGPQYRSAFVRGVQRGPRQLRVMASLSYHMLTSPNSRRYFKRSHSCHEFNRPDVFTLAAIGYTSALLAAVAEDSSLLNSTDEGGRTPLYLAARCGFYDTTKALLCKGAAVNKPQCQGRTPLHGASECGQSSIVKLLLVNGADPSMKNRWNETPVDCAASDSIRSEISSMGADVVFSMSQSLITKGLASELKFVKYHGKVIGKEIVRNRDALDSQTRRYWDDIHSSWERAWHGTKANYLESIVRNGLMPSGTKLSDGKTIKPPGNHYQLSEEHFGVANWAKAVFLSPSILYASHVCYSERVISEGEQWCILVKARVKPASYKSYDPTVVFQRDPIDGEPDTPEYRVPVRSELDTILRVESSRNVVISSIVFIRVDFLEGIGDTGLTFDKLHSLFK